MKFLYGLFFLVVAANAQISLPSVPLPALPDADVIAVANVLIELVAQIGTTVQGDWQITVVVTVFVQALIDLNLPVLAPLNTLDISLIVSSIIDLLNGVVVSLSAEVKAILDQLVCFIRRLFVYLFKTGEGLVQLVVDIIEYLLGITVPAPLVAVLEGLVESLLSLVVPIRIFDQCCYIINAIC